MKLTKDMMRLYAVTDRSWLRGQTLYEQVEQALIGGATLVQLREKELDEEAFLCEAVDMAKLCHRYGVPRYRSPATPPHRPAPRGSPPPYDPNRACRPYPCRYARCSSSAPTLRQVASPHYAVPRTIPPQEPQTISIIVSYLANFQAHS